MSVNRLTLFALLLLGALPCSLAQAQEPAAQSLASIRAAAEKAVRDNIDAALAGVELQASALDPRLRLAACTSRLDTFAPAPRHTQSRVPVRVSCPAPAWTMNVPVEIRRTHQVLVLRRAVGRGEAIAPKDVMTQSRVLPGLVSPFVSSADQLPGRLSRRPIPEGAALTAESLSAALLIYRGQNVTLVAHAAGFQVRAPGKALADASANQRVRVQNLNSLKIVEGLADNDGTVRVLP